MECIEVYCTTLQIPDIPDKISRSFIQCFDEISDTKTRITNHTTILLNKCVEQILKVPFSKTCLSGLI